METLKRLGGLLAFVLAFVGAKYGMQYYRDFTAGQAVEERFEQARLDAVQKHPDLPPSLAFAQESQKKAAAQLQDQSDLRKKQSDAADMFWGFYLINTRSRVEYCKDRSVDIQPFVNAFEALHVEERNLATQIYRRDGVDVNKVYAQTKEMQNKTVAQDMADIARELSVTEDDACRVFADYPVEFAAEMKLEKAAPAVYAALHTAG